MHCVVNMSDLVCVRDFERYAFKVLPRSALGYYSSGAGQETTLANNRAAFNKLRIRPRCLMNVANRDLSTTVLGTKISMPVGIAPTAMQRMAHPDGETANVKAAQTCKTVFVQSTISTSSIEEVASALECTEVVPTIHLPGEVTLNLIRRAERAGFKAIVLTVDTPFFGLRLADIRNKFSLPSHLKFANFQGEKASKINEDAGDDSSLSKYVNDLFDASLTWNDVHWLLDVTKLPVILKGILTAEDAIIGAELGVAGIIVSNHGARQIDGTPASIEALPEIVAAVGDKVEVYLDGGITDGADVFKALALGAKMVFIGRPALWGLTHSGQAGVEKVLNILQREFDFAMAMTGCSSVKDITSKHVVHESYYSKL